jgi:hypothetical protein
VWRRTIRPRENLDSWLLHIGRMHLLIEGCFEDPLAQFVTLARLYIMPRMGTAQRTLRSFDSAKGRSFGAAM